MKIIDKISGLYWDLIKGLNSVRPLRPLSYVIDVETYRNPKIQRILLFVSFVIILAFIMAPETRFTTVEYKVGDYAPKDIKASKDYIIVDKEATERERTEAVNTIPSVFDLDGTALVSLFDRIESAFNLMREVSAKAKNEKERNLIYDENRGAFSDLLDVKLPDSTFEELKKQNFNQQIEKTMKRLLEGLSGYYIAGSFDTISAEVKRKGVTLINSQTKSETLLLNLDKVIDIETARNILGNKARSLSPEVSSRIVKPALEVSRLLIKPNVTYNLTETDRRKELAAEKVKPVTIKIEKGQMIIEDGYRIDKNHLTILNGIAESQKDYNLFLIFLGILTVISILVYVSYIFASKNISKFKSSNKDLLFYCIVILVFMIITKFGLFIADAFGDRYENIPQSAFKFAIPVIAGAMLVRIVLNSESAILYTIISSIFSGIILGDDVLFMSYLFVGSLLGAHLVAQTKQRSTLVYAGFVVGLVNILLIFLLSVSRLKLLYVDVLSSISSDPGTVFSSLAFALFGFFGAIIASVLVLGITPVVELLFGYTTDIKLVELSNLDHPLLKDMVIRAPGTYHHSIIVGNLAEAGATAINANPLLARVSAYYHDIGKIKKPNYFIENTTIENNPHDRLSPHMSSLILISHVKDGVDLAKKYKLGNEIIDVIQQHHGTHLINYFYQRAVKSDDGKGNPVDEKSFRYPGPKPQTREAGLVLLADNVEAASKVLTDPKPARVEAMVQSIIERLFLDGQLDQCELTLKDLDAIGRSFIQVLNGIFHQRIDYPEPVIDPEREEEETEAVKVDGTDKKREAP